MKKLLRSNLAFALSATLIASASVYATPVTTATSFIVGQEKDFLPTTANEEGYWYSRYNLTALSMQSGMGMEIPMEKIMSMMPALMMSVGASVDNPVTPPVNPTMLMTVYKSGNPHYLNTPNQKDFSTLKWKSYSKTLSNEASAWTIVKELEWAKAFHRNAHFGQANVDNFGANERFAGVMLALMAKMQMQAYGENMADYEMPKAGDYALLIALSDGTNVYSSASQTNNEGVRADIQNYPAENRYTDKMAEDMFSSMAASHFTKVLNSKPTTIRDLSLAIQSVVWYASVTQNNTEFVKAKNAVTNWGNELAKLTAKNPTDLAYQVRGLIEVGRTTKIETYLQTAASVFKKMINGFDIAHGVLKGTITLTIDGIGEIVGAFNAADLFLEKRIDQTAAKNIFTAWWEGSINLSGLQLSAPDITEMKSAYEITQSPLNYRYPTTPLPTKIAPVFAASITWKNNAWQANQNKFDTAGAMHAANEMVWLHSDELNGFPDVNFSK